MELTEANYFSSEANREFMSNSQYGDFLECPARTVAILNNKWQDEEKSKALAMGSYVDNALLTPEALDDFVAATQEFWFKRERKSKANPEPPYKLNEPKADKETCDRMVARCKRDEYFMLTLQGQHQVIVTWEMFGVRWKAKLDVSDPESGYFCDLKTCASFDQFEWDAEIRRKVPFTEKYWRQFGGVYWPAYKAHYGEYPKAVLMSAVTKQDPPDIGIWTFTDTLRFEDEMAKIELELPQIIAWKTGKETPRRCGACDYCRETKVLGAESIIVAENCKPRGMPI